MPIYSYYCQNCKKEFDLLVREKEKENSITCFYCRNSKINKVPSLFGITSKTDYPSIAKNSCSGGDCSSCSGCRT